MKSKIVGLLIMGMIIGWMMGCRHSHGNRIDSKNITGEKEAKELVIFAAASLTETLNQLAKHYQEIAPEVRLVFQFDSSGILKTQITEGAVCDVFISAAPKQMDELDGSASAETNFLLPGSRIDLLENQVVLVVSQGNPAQLESYDDWAEGLREGGLIMAMGNADVPVGQYSQKILAFYGLDEHELANRGRITYGTNVKEVTAQVAEAMVDCGIVYATDACSAGLTVIDTATEEMCGQVIYPAAVMQSSKNPKLAQAFLDYLTTEEAEQIFTAVGFRPIMLSTRKNLQAVQERGDGLVSVD